MPSTTRDARSAASPIQAITFDVGGTLIEPFPSVGHIYAEVAARYGLQKVSAQQLNRRFATAWCAQPGFAHTRAAWADLVDETSHGLSDRLPSETFFDELFERFSQPDAWRVFEDVVPALESLAARGLKLGIISNWDDRLRPLLHRLRLARWFDPIVVSCEVGFPKPRPEPFQRATTQLGLAPGSVLHIGDSPENDVRAARCVGFQALRLQRGSRSRARGVIRSLIDLASLL